MVRVTFYGIDLVTLRSFFFWSLVILGVLTYGISLYEWFSNGRVVKRAKTAMLKKHGNKPMYLILANPIGGDGKARSIYDNILLPMLERAEIRSKLVMTKHAGHARSIAADIDPNSVDALILISGDGMVHEVMQGFADKCRNDADKLKELYQQVPLGLIPGGSSNGLAASFGHFDAVQGCIGIINGKQHLLDVQEIDLPAVEGKCGKKKALGCPCVLLWNFR